MNFSFVRRASIATALFCAASSGVFADEIPNNFPFLNSAGTAATYSTSDSVDLENAFHALQGANGRTCESCHLPQAGWSVRPLDVELAFLFTGGKDPLFNVLDANSPTANPVTLKDRLAAYSMLRKGLFRRGGNLPSASLKRFGPVRCVCIGGGVGSSSGSLRAREGCTRRGSPAAFGNCGG